MPKSVYIYIIIFFFDSIVFAQRVDFFGAGFVNNYHEYKPIANNNFENGNGFCLGVGFYNISFDSLLLRFSAALNYYEGSVNSSTGSIIGSSSTNAHTKKMLASLGFYPLNFLILSNKLHLNLGCEFSILINSRTTGSQLIRNFNSITHIKLEETSININNNFNVCLTSRVAYLAFESRNGLIFFPFFQIVFGLNNDFVAIGTNAKTSRIGIGLCVRKK